MRAVVFPSAGGPEIIQLVERPDPEPGAQQVRVRVAAAGLNRADVLQRRGLYPAPPGWPADIPGLEYAGVVESAGPGVSRWRVGDRVMGLVGGGAFAEYVVVHEDEALAVPPGLDVVHAAAIPEAFLTAWDAMVTRGRLARGERLLVHAVASGVGTAAIQLGRALGAVTLGTSRTAAKLERCRALGLEHALRTDPAGLDKAVGEPVHVVLDLLGGPWFAASLRVLAPRGRLVLLGLIAGSEAHVELGLILRKRLEVTGTVMRPRLHAERAPLVAEFAARALPLFASGALAPVVEEVLPMRDVAEAHRRMDANETFGKLVLAW